MKYLLVLLCFLQSLAFADVYMKQEDGGVIYSDTPTPGATKLTIEKPASTVSSKTTTTTITKETTTEATPVSTDTAGVDADAVSEAPNYTQFLIDSPLDQQTIQNQRSIPVTFVVKPDLKKGDKIQVYLDDKAVGAPVSSTTVDLSNLERGSHRLRGTLLDKNNNPIRQTQSVTVFIHYAHVGNLSNTKNSGGGTPP